jgi:uncharacterized protein (DUF433 family)
MAQETSDLVLTRYIDTVFFQKRPHIRGRRVPVAAVAYNARDNGWDVPRLAREFSLSQAEVLAALLYYETHQDEIDTQEARYRQDLDAMPR